ncbi:hypothetical protein ACVIHB_009576 [Bradyrhizobium liaoningense]
MTQPAEAEQRNFPILRRRLEIEDRAAVAIDDLAGEDEPAGIDFGGAGRASAVRRSCGAMISRSVRPGQTRDSATEPPLARASMFRAKRFMTSVEICLR